MGRWLISRLLSYPYILVAKQCKAIEMPFQFFQNFASKFEYFSTNSGFHVCAWVCVYLCEIVAVLTKLFSVLLKQLEIPITILAINVYFQNYKVWLLITMTPIKSLDIVLQFPSYCGQTTYNIYFFLLKTYVWCLFKVRSG